jgi:2-dehydro-3-deoxyphosphogluconate aldolase/(4S)-4-hydroxy-2-oxoglutarate aldolase
MNNPDFSWNRFSAVPIVGIIRNLSFDIVEKILPVYLSSGLTHVEITMNTPRAEEIIKFAAQNYKGLLNIGAGTVCNTHDLKLALDAGAQFIVTPIIDAEVIKACVSLNIPVFPGAFTPTEIYQAWKMGATMVKVYPAASLGSNYIRDVKAPLNQIKLMPTGGINLDNIQAFMDAGADALGIGSQLFDKKLIKNEDWNGLELHFKKHINMISLNS